MSVAAVRSSTELDDLDRRLLQALQLDGRIPFNRAAAVLGVSEQTVARRYRRMRDARVLRVVGVHNAWAAGDDVFVRIATRPGSAHAIGLALARRADVSWVAAAVGDAEVTCALHAEPGARDALLAERLPRLSRVVGMGSRVILRKFPIDPSTDALGRDAPLATVEIEALRAPAPDGETVILSDEDRLLLRQLRLDGRRSFAQLAAVVGRSEGFVARRVLALRSSGALVVQVGVSLAALGFATTATLWVTAPPSQVAAIGARLAEHPEVTFVGVVSGPASLVVTVACRDVRDLYRYVTERLGSIAEVGAVDVVVDRLVKRRGSLMDHDGLLADPADGE